MGEDHRITDYNLKIRNGNSLLTHQENNLLAHASKQKNNV